MSTLIEQLVLVCQRVGEKGDWVTPVATALDGIEANAAAWIPHPDQKSIAEITDHMLSWTTWCLRFLDGLDTDVTDWPDCEDRDDTLWDLKRRSMIHAMNALRARIGALSIEELEEAPLPEVTETTRFLAIQSVLVHNAYHAGQITKLRQEYERTMAEQR